MTAFARLVLRHRKLILLGWAALFIAGLFGAGAAVNRMSADFSLPGQPGSETAAKVLHAYGTAADIAPYLLVITAQAGQSVNVDRTDAAFAAVQSAVPTARIIGHAQTGDPIFETRDGRSAFAYAFIPQPTAIGNQLITRLQTALTANTPPTTSATVSGIDALATGGTADTSPGLLAETLIGGVGALGVLLFVFASFLALVPLLVAAVAILTTFLVLLGITYFSDVSYIVQFVVGLIGLGVAIDYALIIVTRWREERAHGLSNHDAVVVSMQTAGRAVVFSGLAVAVGLVALVVLPVPFLRSVGYGGMLIPLVSVAVATTMLPAILGGIGPRIDWPRIRHENVASRFWTSWGKGVVRHRWLAAGAAVAILALLVVQFLNLSIAAAKSDSLSKSGPTYDAWHALDSSGVPHGVLTPIIVDTQTSVAGSVATRIRGVNDIVTAFAPTGEVATAAGTTLVIAIPRQETYNGATVQVVRDVQTAVAGAPGIIGVSGVGALELDVLSGVYGNLPLLLLLIVLVTFVLLVRTFRSLLLPLKAIVLNFASVSATFGGLVLFWQDGYGSKAVYGIAPTGSIDFFIPIMTFAFLFGLSMDYEVFILARMREEYDVTGSTDDAVIAGLGRTGRLVTSAALVLFLAFLSLSSGPETLVKVFATGLAFGILLDATVVRMLLVPALVSLFGDWNWYLPDSVARFLRIQPSHISAREVRAQRAEAA